MPAGTNDPLAGFQYILDITGVQNSAYFTECSGIGSEHEIIEHKVSIEGKDYVQKVPGRMKWTDVTLKRGITGSMDIWEWRKMVEDGDMQSSRKHCSITMLDREGKAVAKWDFENAWPSKVSGPDLKADSNDFGVEEMVLVHERMKRVKV
ncbi:MAG: phage tail protein [Chloroflexota bacterium]|jgi:phage tail-like protein